MFFIKSEKETITAEEKNLIRASAYTAIEKYNLTSLPANEKVLEYLLSSKYYMIMSIQKLAYFSNTDIEECLHVLGGQGSIYYDSGLNKYTIFYNKDISNELVTWIIASLIAAVELDLVPIDDIFVINPDNEYLEEFASYFLAPDPVLYECKISSPGEVSKVCQIPFKYALRKSKRLKKTFAKTALDEYIKYKFSNFIQDYKK
ncbi:hypothetical protein [[Clostridium] scindens]|uniref:hypothetical protein n=1 Tax=Clostridium scindens (strain JCM 10418 / VPI 12708) TaxID=29347 RepID=UPI00241CCF7C|nr:hypothetical protein [[Clostridium] scindens]